METRVEGRKISKTNKRKQKKGVQEAQKQKKKTLKLSPPTRSDDSIRVSVKDAQSYPEILKVMKARVINSSDAELEVLTIIQNTCNHNYRSTSCP